MDGVTIMGKLSESRKAANKRYDAKTYKPFTMNLRIDNDADIIEDIELAKANGISYREWLRKLYDSQQSK